MRKIGDEMYNSEYVDKIYSVYEGWVEVFDFGTKKNAKAFGGGSFVRLEYEGEKGVSFVSRDDFDFGDRFVLRSTYVKAGMQLPVNSRILQTDIDNGFVDMNREVAVFDKPELDRLLKNAEIKSRENNVQTGELTKGNVSSDKENDLS